MSRSQPPSRHDVPSAAPGTAASQPVDDETKRPGIPEIVAALGVWAVAVFLLTPQLRRLELDAAVHGLVLTWLAGLFGAAGFAAAYALRVRSLSALGVRRVSRRWILIAVAVGVVTLVVKSLASGAWMLLSGDTSNAQAAYAQGANGGVLFLILATVGLGILTPIGEELVFRGVVATALLRYGPVVGVVGSALIFALFHGINPVFPGAFIIGLATAELYRRTNSLWPSIVVHVVVNLPAPLISVLAGLG